MAALASAVDRAISIKSLSEQSYVPSESPRPSGLTATERIELSPRASGPSSTTTLLNTINVHDYHDHHVSLQPEAQYFHIGSTSRASGSTRAAARAELELELALAKEHRIQMQLQALEVSSSLGGSDAGSLADRLSLAGLGSHSSKTRRAAPAVQGAARSPRTPGADGDDAAAIPPSHLGSQAVSSLP